MPRKNKALFPVRKGKPGGNKKRKDRQNLSFRHIFKNDFASISPFSTT
jgi:hypothetical protein